MTIFRVAVWLLFWSLLQVSRPAETQQGTRTAVCMCGLVRSMNLTFTSGNILVDEWNRPLENDTETVIDNMIRNILVPLADTGFDVFMYLPVSKYQQPEEKAISYCDLMRRKPIFTSNSDNRFFCILEQELNLHDDFVAKFPYWSQKYAFGERNYEARHRLLQEMYGLYKCNEFVQKYEVARGLKYTYKMRLRMDTPLLRPMPRVTDMDFKAVHGRDEIIDTPAGQCARYIRVSSKHTYPGAHEVTFNVGYAADMDVRLDGYFYFVRGYVTPRAPSNWVWTTENLLTTLLAQHGICLVRDERIQLVRAIAVDVHVPLASHGDRMHYDVPRTHIVT